MDELQKQVAYKLSGYMELYQIALRIDKEDDVEFYSGCIIKLNAIMAILKT